MQNNWPFIWSKLSLQLKMDRNLCSAHNYGWHSLRYSSTLILFVQENNSIIRIPPWPSQYLFGEFSSAARHFRSRGTQFPPWKFATSSLLMSFTWPRVLLLYQLWSFFPLASWALGCGTQKKGHKQDSQRKSATQLHREGILFQHST